MAEENKILYKITVDTETATAQIRKLGEGALKRTQIAVEDVNKVLGEMNGEMSRTSSEIGKTMASLKKQRSQVQINSKEYQNLTKIMRFYQSQMDMSTGATGSATSAAMELGRVASDMPYGIRGVANNISQFASQMAFAAKSTGSFKLALIDLGKAMTGPLGILLLIQGVIAVFEKMSMSKKKATEDSENLNKALKDEIKTLEGYESILNNANSSLEDRNGAIMAAIAGNKKYAKSILEGNDTLLGQESALKALLEEKKKQLELDDKLKELNPLNEKLKTETRSVESLKAKLEELEKSHVRVAAAGKDGSDGAMRRYLEERLGLQELIKDLERQKELLDEIQGLVEPPRQVVERSVEWYKQQISFAEKTRDQLSTTSIAYKDQTKVIEGLRKELEKITGVEDKNKRTKKLSPFATPKELEIDIKSAENAIIRYEKKIEDARLKKELNDKLSEAKTEEEKATIRRNYEKDKLINQIKAERKSLKLKKSTEEEVVKTKVANHKAELERKHREFVYSVKLKEKLGEITSKQSSDLISQSDELTNKAMSQADKEAEISVEQIREKYKPLFALFESLAGSRLDALFSMPTKDGGKKDEDSDLEFGIKQYMILQSGLTDFLNGEYDRQLTIEQNKTNAMNNQLRERLNNENLSAEERKNIQLQIARNDEQLRKKQEEIEKKRFKVQKAINIANALVDTYRSGVMAFGSQLVIGDPTSPIRAQIAQGVAIAAGLANVAMIARQKFQSTAGGAPTAGALGGGGSGGGDNTREFNFNLAGSTQSNQLTQSIAGQLSQPIQTYVVSSEITSQQQLDLNIANTATIGG